MATPNQSSLHSDPAESASPAPRGPHSRQHRRSRWPWLVLAVLSTAAAWYGPGIIGYARTAASVGARVACSCRYVAGRKLGDCRKDFDKGMGLVMLSDDAEAKTVTARYPLLASQRATFRDGWGCVLDPWVR